jgi:hypothetical protein
MSLFGRLLCGIGIHSNVNATKWTPSITARIVEEFEQKVACRYCGKVALHTHLRWDGNEMIDLTSRAQAPKGQE